MSLTIGSVFTKDITRPIEGVIKADDAEHLGTEIEEYVLTGETAGALDDLLATYTAPVYGGGNGVWVSGFFGSGKSHLLKMLAHLLGDVSGQSYPRDTVVKEFRAKAVGDSMLTASLDKTAAIPATSLLFNIDVKAPLIDKSQRDALLQVFVKVFNEARGYYAGDPSVARFERDLDRRGLLGPFTAAFQEVAGVPWGQGREEGILQEHNVTAAWSQVTGEPATANILARYEDQFQLSIEDFADEVADWLASQSPNHRLLFMVDEVGQFIGQDTHLMLNLQSIVEQLSTKCQGRAWVCVTSQEDIDGVIGDQTKAQANDFSKIQARFATRMKLTSRDVEEVIEKRLLSKNPDVRSALAELYDAQEANFRTLFDFVDGATTYRNYQSPDHFIDVYPFVPYQFPLFQAALRGLSEHNVFEGRHASVGERSMLGVVQDVTKQLIKAPIGSLVPFDLMFSGISRSVKSAATQNIATAEQNLPASEEREVAIRLLKALFLVKYIKGFTATPRNLTVLLYDQFDTDLSELNRQVMTGLELLERQTYVQRNGAAYEYLTNEEQEIEQEIKNTEIDTVEVSKLLNEIIKDVRGVDSYRHQATGRDFKYEIRLDDASYSRAQPQAVHFISPALGQPREVILAQSMGRDEVRVILANDLRLYPDLRRQVQTDKYIRQKTGSRLTDTQRHILDAKSRLNTERRRDLIGRVKTALGDAEIVINGAAITVTSHDPVTRIADGVSQLIARMYSGLKLLGDTIYAEQDIVGIISEAPALIDRGNDRLQPAADEVGSFIIQQRGLGVTVTVKKIVENFEDKPYGWPLPAIQVAIARLWANATITLTLDGHLLKRTEITEALRATKKHANLQVSEQKQFDSGIVQRVRAFAQEFFDSGDFPTDALDLAAKVKDRLVDKLNDLQTTRQAYADRYSFITELDGPIRLLDEVTGRGDDWYLTEFVRHTDGLLDAKADAIDPIKAFLAGSQKTIYDKAVQLLEANRDNLPYLHGGEATTVKTLLDSPKIFRASGGMTRLKDATAALEAATDKLLKAERDRATAVINDRWSDLEAGNAYHKATNEACDQASQLRDRSLKMVTAATSVPVIRQQADDFEEQGFNTILGILEQSWPQANNPETAVTVTPLVPIRSLLTRKAQPLETTDDADAYVEELRGVLHQTIAEGKRVSL